LEIWPFVAGVCGEGYLSMKMVRISRSSDFGSDRGDLAQAQQPNSANNTGDQRSPMEGLPTNPDVRPVCAARSWSSVCGDRCE